MNAPQRSEAWFKQRSGRLTASCFGAALGLSPYMSRQALWRDLTGRGEPFAGNPATDWGTAHEPDAISAYEEHTGDLVLASEFIRADLGFPSGCSPDGFVGKAGTIEAKCPFSLRVHEEVPVHYMPQVLATIHIPDREWCDYICWTPEAFKIHRVRRDDKTWARIKESLAEFWRHIEDDVEPKRQAKFKF
jgi:putative phage-type endonuclease